MSPPGAGARGVYERGVEGDLEGGRALAGGVEGGAEVAELRGRGVEGGLRYPGGTVPGVSRAGGVPGPGRSAGCRGQFGVPGGH
ncbi:hypothetical protein DV096_07990 [Bradymonadaceae bacterium TMQ3]|nr:hypothetical protein DV096_07990 [Bradymonadaceae bacterium TMQ3]TXC76490.1 hypothetical protein FRC91_07085 [Bradymonadales bacterium TMQ1]